MNFGCLRFVVATWVRARAKVLGEVGNCYGWDSQATEIHTHSTISTIKCSMLAACVDHEVDHFLAHFVVMEVQDFFRRQIKHRMVVANLAQNNLITEPALGQRFDVRHRHRWFLSGGLSRLILNTWRWRGRLNA